MKISSIFAILTASAILAACDFLDEYNPNSVTVGNYYIPKRISSRRLMASILH